jgi:hypothetical protein
LCKYSDYIWWFTDGALHYAKARNHNLDTPGNARGFVVMPGANPPITAERASYYYGKHLNLCHFGSLANDRSLSIILKAAHTLIAQYPEARQALKVNAYGAPLDSLTLEAIKQYGYDDLLMDHGRLERDPVTGQSGRERVAQKMQEADVLILLHGCDEWCSEYIPSKFYDYLWASRPIWAITHRNPQLDQILQERGSYLSVDGDEVGIAKTLERIWLDWKLRQLITPRYDPIGVDQAVAQILKHVQPYLHSMEVIGA